MNAGSRLGQLWGLKYLHSLNRKGHDKAGPPLLTYVVQLLIAVVHHFVLIEILFLVRPSKYRLNNNLGKLLVDSEHLRSIGVNIISGNSKKVAVY